jgi:predicted SprT family Zn-dependent metalloprotease
VRIPIRFMLGGVHIDTAFIDTLIQKDDAKGMAVYMQNKIELQKPSSAYPLSDEQVGHTYCHEVVHYILYAMSHKLRTD